YSPANRTYLLGQVVSEFQYRADLCSMGMGIARQIKWNTDEIDSDPLKDMEIQALERIKDKIITLDADEMELLVAGILRGMGYKT
ncbi:restriction endonuclease, partial [Proteus terrae]